MHKQASGARSSRVAPVPAGQLEGKVAIVTGGAGGLGRAASQALGTAGARALIVDLDERGGREVAEAVGGDSCAAGVSRPEEDAAPVQTVPLYAANKHGVVRLGRSLGPALLRGIHFKAVCPGFPDSTMIGPVRDQPAQDGIPVIPTEAVADAVLRPFAGDMAGECWFVRGGREAGPFRFRGIPARGRVVTPTRAERRTRMDEKSTLFVCHGDQGGPKMHPCRRVQEAMQAAGIGYEKVIAGHGSPIPFLRRGSRDELRQATGDTKLPALKLPDGTVLKHSRQILGWIRDQGRQPGADSPAGP